MIRTISGLVASSLAVALTAPAVGLAPGLVAPAHGTAADPPLAMSGSVPGVVDQVRVTVLPPDLRPGDGPQRLRTVDADVRVDGTTWQAFLDPGAIPPGYVHDNGVYDFLVEATGRNRSYSTEVSARAVSSSSDPDQTAWVDASDTAHLSPPAGVPSAGATATVDPSTIEEHADLGVPTGQYAGSDAPCNYWAVEAVATRLRSTTIGTSYPLSTSTAWMQVSSSQGADYGVAMRFSDGPASFSKAGSRFTKSGWSKTWEPSVANRAYRKEIEYTKYDYTCSDIFTHAYVWRPTGETGGATSAYGLERPDWNVCANVAPGPWSRNSSNGHSYTYDAAVKFAAIIGIDLSIDRNYSHEQFITYHVRGQKKLCGNGHYPAVAGKIMERFR